MQNYERYKDVIIDVLKDNSTIALKNGEPVKCELCNCEECDFYIPKKRECSKSLREKWLKSEAMNYFEIELLKRLYAQGLNYLIRDKDKNLFATAVKPIRNYGWEIKAGKVVSLSFITDTEFSFVIWENSSPWSIEKLLGGVANDS